MCTVHSFLRCDNSGEEKVSHAYGRLRKLVATVNGDCFLGQVCSVLSKCSEVPSHVLAKKIVQVISGAPAQNKGLMALCAVGYVSSVSSAPLFAFNASEFLQHFFNHTINTVNWSTQNWYAEAKQYFTSGLRRLCNAKFVQLCKRSSELGLLIFNGTVQSHDALGIRNKSCGEARIVATVMLLCAMAMSAAENPRALRDAARDLLGAAKPLELASEVRDPELVNKWFSLFVEVTLTAVDPPGRCSAAKAEAIVALLGCLGDAAKTAKYIMQHLKDAKIRLVAMEVLKRAVYERRCAALDLANEFVSLQSELDPEDAQNLVTFLAHTDALAFTDVADRIPKSTLRRCNAKDPSPILRKALDDTTLMQCECRMTIALLQSIKAIYKAATVLVANSECASDDVTMHQLRGALETLYNSNNFLNKAELQSTMRAIAKINTELERPGNTPPGIVRVCKRAAASSGGNPVRFRVVVREHANPQHSFETELDGNTTIADFVQCSAFTDEFACWGDDTILTLDGVEIPIYSGVLLEHLCDGAGILELVLCQRREMALRIAVSLDEATRAIVRGNAPSAFEEPPCLRDPKIYLWAHENVSHVEVEAALLHIVSSQCALTQSSARECLQVTQKSQRRYVISMQPKVPVQLVPVHVVDEAVVLVPTVYCPAVPSHDDLLRIARAACHRLQCSAGLWCECCFDVSGQDEAEGEALIEAGKKEETPDI